MRKVVDFGLALSDPTERDLAKRIFYGLARIEQEIRGCHLAESVACKDEATFEREYVVTGLVYYPHHSHVDNLVVCLVDDLHTISGQIDRVDDAGIQLLLRDWYYLVKDALCKDADAEAYYLSR